MSGKFIELDNGLYMEVEAEAGEIEAISGGDMVERVDKSIDGIKDVLIKSIKPVSETYQELNRQMSVERAEVELAIGFSAEGNIFIAKGRGSANLKVKLVLSPKEK